MPFRNVDTGVWNDPEFVDEYTVSLRYFWLYLLTNPHNSICGVARISKRTIAYETGYDIDTVSELIDKFKNEYKKIDYDEETQEIIIIKWYRYNWTKSQKLLTNVVKNLSKIKCERYVVYLTKLVKIISNLKGEINTVSIQYRYVTDPIPDPITISDTDSITDTDIDSIDISNLLEETIDESDIEKSKTENLYERFEFEFGRPLSQPEFQRLSDWICSDIETALLPLALKEASLYKKYDFNYIAKILDAWKQKGFTADQIAAGKHCEEGATNV